MKKVILSIAVFAATVQMSNAQNKTVGVVAGASYNILSFDQESVNGIGYTVGLTSFIPFGDKWGFRPEVNFQQRRLISKESDSFTSDDFNYAFNSESKISYYYIDFPLLMQFNGGTGFGFFVGPQFGLNIGGKEVYNSTEKYTDLGTGEVIIETNSETDKFKGDGLSEFSIVLGPTYTFDFGLSLELRAQRTIGILSDGDFDTEIAWTVFQVGARYSIPIGK